LRTVEETSAGGLVVDRATARAALIGRLDRRGVLLWSLPKGHLEAGETAEQAAVREVREETGITGAVLRGLGQIDYWFVVENRRVHKTVHHFLLEALGGELSDDDVEVTEVAWVPLGELDDLLAYTDERRLARRAVRLLAESGDRALGGQPEALPNVDENGPARSVPLGRSFRPAGAGPANGRDNGRGNNDIDLEADVRTDPELA
jgi:8-oxo-dGTP pyrophosphatase MutT (NUDIX family)